MREVIAIKPLPEWEIDGKIYKANERTFTTSPPELEQHISVGIGSWFELPSGNAGVSVASRLKTQNGKQLDSKDGQPPRFEGGTHPTLQRFAFEIRQVAEAGDNLDALFADTPIRKVDGSTAENPLQALRAQIESLQVELGLQKAENETLKAEAAKHAKKK